MKFKSLASLLLLAASSNLTAQTIVTIANEDVPTSDFVAMYKKNNIEDAEKMSAEEYMNLFINFKLKVKEAEALGLDKDPAFIEELNGYRDQLAKPYLVDEQTNQKLIDEAYENMKYDIRASHILIEVPKYAAGKDTLDAWNKIMELRQRAIDGEDFNELAFKYSEDPSARDRQYQGRNFPANKGDLGYFTAFNMIYPFEHVAFQTPVGEISMPVRTSYGYHIIKVTDKQPAMGVCQVSHIIFNYPSNATAEDSLAVQNHAAIIYDSIMNGMKFEEAARKYSNDPSTAKQGGLLTPFTCNQLEANFIKAITELTEPNQISKPVETIYGCHIIKLISKKGIPAYEDEVENIKRKINQSDRVQVEIDALGKRLKQDYNFVENIDNVEEIIPIFMDNFSKLDSVVFENDKVIFSFADKTMKQSDLIKFINKNKNKNTLKAASTVYSQFESLVNESLLDYEKHNLEKKHDNFRLLMQEYHDGILLFNVNEKEIWSKSTSDTASLRNFYESNKDKYVWNDRVEATIYKILDPTAEKEAMKLAKKGVENKEIVKTVNKDAKSFRITMETGFYEQGDNAVVDIVKHKKGISKVVTVDGIDYFVQISQILPAGNKTFEECKGHVISDYQNYLETLWLEELKSKYNVTVNQAELDKIK